jgi:Lon protease-like protein
MATKLNLPMFPLGIVVLPGEEFYLHIFEPRYKQLISDIQASEKTFLIPYEKEGAPQFFGTEVKLKTVFSVYPDGEMDISVIGLRVFRLNGTETMTDRLYDRALVNVEDFLPAEPRQLLSLRPLLMEYLQLKKGEPVKLALGRPVTSFDAAILLNLTPDKKYTLISMFSEPDRVKWLANELLILLQARKMEIQLQQNFYLN